MSQTTRLEAGYCCRRVRKVMNARRRSQGYRAGDPYSATYATSFDVSDWLFEHTKTAKTLAAGQLIFLGVVVSIVIGV